MPGAIRQDIFLGERGHILEYLTLDERLIGFVFIPIADNQIGIGLIHILKQV